MSKKEEEKQEETQEETQEDHVLDDLREVVNNMEDGEAKTYAEMQLEDFDHAANDSQKARVLSNLRVGLRHRTAIKGGNYRTLFNALPQRTRSKDMAKEAEFNRRLNGFLAMAKDNMEFISMLNQKASEKKGIKAGTPHTADSWAASMAEKSMRDTPYQKEASQ